MVLLCCRSDEGRHHGVSNELLDCPARLHDLLRHRVVEAVQEGARALRVLRVGELGRANEVREQDGGELAFLARRLLSDRRGASGAEARAGGKCCTASSTVGHAAIVPPCDPVSGHRLAVKAHSCQVCNVFVRPSARPGTPDGRVSGALQSGCTPGTPRAQPLPAQARTPVPRPLLREREIKDDADLLGVCRYIAAGDASSKREGRPFERPIAVAGAGFEPATSGL